MTAISSFTRWSVIRAPAGRCGLVGVMPSGNQECLLSLPWGLTMPCPGKPAMGTEDTAGKSQQEAAHTRLTVRVPRSWQPSVRCPQP